MAGEVRRRFPIERPPKGSRVHDGKAVHFPRERGEWEIVERLGLRRDGHGGANATPGRREPKLQTVAADGAERKRFTSIEPRTGGSGFESTKLRQIVISKFAIFLFLP